MNKHTLLVFIIIAKYNNVQTGKSGFKEGNKMFIREYQSSDCKELAKLFYNTVHTVNAKDYTKEQLDAWATGQIDLKA